MYCGRPYVSQPTLPVLDGLCRLTHYGQPAPVPVSLSSAQFPSKHVPRDRLQLCHGGLVHSPPQYLVCSSTGIHAC